MSDAAKAGGAPSVSDLPLHDQILHGIGRVAQAQVQVEQMLRYVHTWLAFPSAAAYLTQTRRGIDALAKDCLAMIDNCRLPSEWKEVGKDAIRAAGRADELRHRAVHDHWVGADGDEHSSEVIFYRVRQGRTAVNLSGVTIEPSSLDFVNNAEAELLRARIRLMALFFALSSPETMGNAHHLEVQHAEAAALQSRSGLDPTAGPTLDELLPQGQGDFTLLPDGSWSVKRTRT